MNLDLPLELIPEDYVMMKIRLPENLVAKLTSISPANEKSARKFGDTWLANAETVLLKVQSAIVPESYNYLINPDHADAKAIKIESAKPFGFDARLFR